MQLICYKSKPLKRDKEISSRLRLWCHQVATSGWFEAFILGCIIFNAVVRCALAYPFVRSCRSSGTQTQKS